VGQFTNFEKLVVRLETDGTISPADAIRSAAKLLIDHLALLIDIKEDVGDAGTVGTASESAAPAAVAPEAEASEEAAPLVKKRGRPKKKAE
jgi:DNA-directed RNA polymerase alpha subunit